jgi:hypothetical protein
MLRLSEISSLISTIAGSEEVHTATGLKRGSGSVRSWGIPGLICGVRVLPIGKGACLAEPAEFFWHFWKLEGKGGVGIRHLVGFFGASCCFVVLYQTLGEIKCLVLSSGSCDKASDGCTDTNSLSLQFPRLLRPFKSKIFQPCALHIVLWIHPRTSCGDPKRVWNSLPDSLRIGPKTCQRVMRNFPRVLSHSRVTAQGFPASKSRNLLPEQDLISAPCP